MKLVKQFDGRVRRFLSWAVATAGGFDSRRAAGWLRRPTMPLRRSRHVVDTGLASVRPRRMAPNRLRCTLAGRFYTVIVRVHPGMEGVAVCRASSAGGGVAAVPAAAQVLFSSAPLF